MKANQQLLQINQNFLICFAISSCLSAAIAQILSDYENHLNTTITIITGYVVYFVIFSILFYWQNKNRYKQTDASLIQKELVRLISSFGVGEIVYLAIRWPTFYFFLELEIEPFISSLTSEIISTGFYMAVVSIFLRGTKTF